MNSKTRTLGALATCLLLAAMLARNADVAALLLIVLAYLGFGILQSPSLEKIQLSAERSLTQSLVNGRAQVAVKLSLHNQATVPVQLSINEDLQAGMHRLMGESSGQIALRPGESATLQYRFTAPRGSYSWDSISIVLSDPLGLIETALALPASARVQIRPFIQKFKAIPFRPNSTLHSPGSIPARLGGSGTDFFGVREYQPGDSLRSLDWRQTARRPDRLFTKEFEQEEIAEVGLILDSRHRTELRVGDQSLFESSVGAAASLAEMFLHQGHRLSLQVFGRGLSSVFPGYGKQQFHRVMNCLSSVKVSPDGFASAFNYLPIRMFPSHSLIIVISPLSPTDKSLFLRLRAMGYQVVLISPDPLDLALPTLAQDPIARLAARAARIERHLQLREIARLRVAVINWPIRDALYPLVRRALMQSRGQRA